jgi:hypothetical protein
MKQLRGATPLVAVSARTLEIISGMPILVVHQVRATREENFDPLIRTQL